MTKITKSLSQKSDSSRPAKLFCNAAVNPGISATLEDLNLFSTSIEITRNVSELALIFEKDLIIPGTVLLLKDQYAGIISRRKFLEYMSKPYSLELYSKRPISYLLDNNKEGEPLIFSDTVKVAEATHLSLQRNPDHLYEPVLVKTKNGEYKILDSHQLLLAQSEIHRLTVQSLREANEFKSEMLSIASHDLKNPLNSIMGFASLIEEDADSIGAVRDMASLIRQGANRMLTLIHQLLDSTAAEQGKITLEKSDVDLALLLADVIKENFGQACKKDQKISFNVESDENYVIICDRQRMHEVIDNLLSNAIKYSLYGRHITINLCRTATALQCSVTDEGQGIRPEEMAKLFGKFQRLSAHPTAGEESTGLGLYIVKQIIELHGGRIFAESEPGKGSKFIFELPL